MSAKKVSNFPSSSIIDLRTIKNSDHYVSAFKSITTDIKNRISIIIYRWNSLFLWSKFKWPNDLN